MKQKYKAIICCSLILFLALCYLNWKYEIIAFQPFRYEGKAELKVLTWNVHCSLGAGKSRQQAIAEFVLKVDADLVLLNEYNQDSCMIIDSMLRDRYPFTVERNSHQKSGDIFYGKRKMSNTGRVFRRKEVEGIQITKTTIAIDDDSVQIFGIHMASNHYDGSTFDKEIESDTTSYDRYKKAQEIRCFQAHWTKKALLESKHPVIVMGDMNDFNCSAPLDTLISCGLKDSWWEGGNGYGATFHDGWMRLRIDHILHSKELKLESIKVIEMDLSDHNPVVAGFSISK